MEEEKLNRIKKINKDYTFLDYLKNNHIIKKCILIITDKQLVFLPAVEGFECDHWLLTIDIQKAMGSKTPERDNENAIYIAAIENTLTLEFPLDNGFSLNQIALMNRVLNDIKEYNNLLKEKGDNESQKVKFLFIDHGVDINTIEDYMLDNISMERLEEEIIIGKTATENELNEVIENLKNKSLKTGRK